MQITERGNEPQRTEVMAINADLLEVVTENNTAIASVRFNGQLRKSPSHHRKRLMKSGTCRRISRTLNPSGCWQEFSKFPRSACHAGIRCDSPA